MKIYEQFVDLSDFSDEEIFGNQNSQKDLMLGKNGDFLYVLYDPEMNKQMYFGYENKYIIYNNKSENKICGYPRSIFSLKITNHELENYLLSYIEKDYLGYFAKVSFDKLNQDIKERINI